MKWDGWFEEKIAFWAEGGGPFITINGAEPPEMSTFENCDNGEENFCWFGGSQLTLFDWRAFVGGVFAFEFKQRKFARFIFSVSSESHELIFGIMKGD